MVDEKARAAFGASIQRLIDRHNLSEAEAYALFCEILGNRQPDLQQGAFLAALVAKGETTSEIVGAWRAICEMDTVVAKVGDAIPLLENSGTGMDALKTFNVSSAAAIVASACGATVARHGARALTSRCGTVDILESVGVDVECDVSTVEKSIQQEGIGLFNGMSPKVHPGGLGRILSQIRFGTTLNIAASLANPAKPTHGLRGVYTRSMVNSVAEVMSSVGYVRGMVVYGTADGCEGGMDELSVCGESVVREFSQSGKGETRTLRPEDVGLKTVSFNQIAAAGDLAAERKRFLQVLTGKGHAACIDFTCLNAGAALFVSERVGDIESGIGMAREAIHSGSAIEKLRRWVSIQNEAPDVGRACLEEGLRAVGV